MRRSERDPPCRADYTRCREFSRITCRTVTSMARGQAATLGKLGYCGSPICRTTTCPNGWRSDVAKGITRNAVE